MNFNAKTYNLHHFDVCALSAMLQSEVRKNGVHCGFWFASISVGTQYVCNLTYVVQSHVEIFCAETKLQIAFDHLITYHSETLSLPVKHLILYATHVSHNNYLNMHKFQVKSIWSEVWIASNEHELLMSAIHFSNMHKYVHTHTHTSSMRTQQSYREYGKPSPFAAAAVAQQTYIIVWMESGCACVLYIARSLSRFFWKMKSSIMSMNAELICTSNLQQVANVTRFIK